MIRIDAIWLATEPLDMRAGADTILARVVKVLVLHDLTTLICSPIGIRPA